MEYGIKYPLEQSESEIQFALHARLLSLGYDSRMEVTERKNISKAFSHRKGYRQCRFDCVIFKNHVAKCIVEVKKSGKDSKTRQMEKYSIYGIPLVFLLGVDDLDRCVHEISRVMQ